MLEITMQDSEINAILPLSSKKIEVNSHILTGGNVQLPIGTYLINDNIKYFQVVGYQEFPLSQHIFSLPQLKALRKIESGKLTFSPSHEGYSLAVVTLSDKGYQGDREDTSGMIIHNIMQNALPLSHISHYILPDNPLRLKALVTNLAYERKYDIIISTGGTGIAPTDLTPEALIPLLSRRFHGFEQAMMTASFAKTPNALISRAFVGTMDKSFIVALQGSPKAVRENLETILPALPHSLEKLHGSTADCATL